MINTDFIVDRTSEFIHINYNRLIHYFYYTTPELFATIFNINVDRVDKVFDKNALSRNPYDFHCNPLAVTQFAKILTALVEAEILNESNLPQYIKWSSHYPNGTKPRHSFTYFKKGHRLSDVPCKAVLSVTDTLLLASEYTGAVSVESADIFIFLLDDTLVLDKDVEFYHCKPSKMAFQDITWSQSLHIENEVLSVSGSVTIRTACPINAVGTVIINGEPGSTLLLENTSFRQPCIGSKTNDGLSYGRWSVSQNRCEKIIIDGVHVTCKSVVPNFMLGEYGTNNVPKIECINGGSLDAIELKGTRVQSSTMEPLYGSTKHSDDPTYVIEIKAGHSILRDVLRDEYHITDEDTITTIDKLLPELCKTDIEFCRKTLKSYGHLLSKGSSTNRILCNVSVPAWYTEEQQRQSKDRQEFLDIYRLCIAHPQSHEHTLTVGDWSFEWYAGDRFVITDNVKNMVILRVTQTTLVTYTTWNQIRLVLQSSAEERAIIFERARQLQRFVTENIHYAPEAKEDVLYFIGNFLFHGVPEIHLEDSCESLRSTFRAGYCYYFAVMLRAAFQRGTICHAYPFSHIIWLDNNDIPYDVEGVYFGEAEKFVPIELIDDIESFKHVND